MTALDSSFVFEFSLYDIEVQQKMLREWYWTPSSSFVQLLRRATEGQDSGWALLRDCGIARLKAVESECSWIARTENGSNDSFSHGRKHVSCFFATLTSRLWTELFRHCIASGREELIPEQFYLYHLSTRLPPFNKVSRPGPSLHPSSRAYQKASGIINSTAC